MTRRTLEISLDELKTLALKALGEREGFHFTSLDIRLDIVVDEKHQFETHAAVKPRITCATASGPQ